MYACVEILDDGVVLEERVAEVGDHVVVVVHHDAERLADYETRPDDDVAPACAPVTLHQLAHER